MRLNNFKSEFYKLLINRENFYMKQYYSNFHKENCFVAIKEVTGGIYCVLITNEKNEEIDGIECIEYIKTLEKPFSFNMIVLSSGEYISLNSYGTNKLVINEIDHSVISCDEACTPLETLFKTMMNNSNIKKYKNNEFLITTLLIIGINVVIFMITAILSGSIMNININVLLRFGAKYDPLIRQGEVWRLLTCAFLHGGLIHILCNMYSLYIIGPQINQIYGTKNYLIIYITSCITSSILSFIMSPYTIAIGASGGIFGLMGALLAFAISERHRIDKRYMSSLIQVIIINLFIGLSLSNIDNFGHIGGFIGGITLGYIIYQIQKKNLIVNK